MSEPIINHFQGTFCPKSYAALKRQINSFSNFKRGFSHIISYQDIAGGCRTKALLDFEPQFWSIQVKNLFYWTHGRSLCTLVPCQQTGRLSRSCSFDLIDVALGGGRRRLQPDDGLFKTAWFYKRQPKHSTHGSVVPLAILSTRPSQVT